MASAVERLEVDPAGRHRRRVVVDRDRRVRREEVEPADLWSRASRRCRARGWPSRRTPRTSAPRSPACGSCAGGCATCRARRRARGRARTARDRARVARPSPGGTPSRCPARRGRRRPRRTARCAHDSTPSLGQQPAPDVGGQVLHRREPALLVGTRRHPALHGLADHPVLLVDQVPQVARVVRVEVVGRDRLGLEEQVAADPGVSGVERPRHERRDVVGCARQPQVRVDQLALVAGALGIVEVAGTGVGWWCRSS